MSFILNHYEMGIQLFVGLVLPPVLKGDLPFPLSGHPSGAPVGDSEALEARTIRGNLLIVPSPLFSDRNRLVRISFAASEETLPVI